MRRLVAPLAGLALAVIFVAPAWAAGGSQADAARAEHQRIVNYWTSQRVAAAKPRDFVRTNHGFVPAAKPGGGGSGAVTGASYTGGGAASESVGKVFFHMGGGDWQCSGSVANDANRSGYSLVLTAGHCAVDETTGEFATNWVFIPAWDAKPATFSTACSASKYGCWTAQALVVHRGFATAGGFNTQATQYDWAFAVVGPGGSNGTTQLDTRVTPFALANFGQIGAGTKMSAFGFPAAGKYHGNDLTWCSGSIFTDAGNANLTWGMACDMTGGSSGGPWFAGFSSGVGTLGSLNSYGYSGVRNMYGPKFNSNTTAVYTAAKTATSNTVVN